MRVDILGNLGAYLSHVRALHSLARRLDGDRLLSSSRRCTRACAASIPTPFRSTPIAAPAGPEAAYLLERLVDAAARELGLPREEIRAKNFVKPSQMPYTTLTARHYDVGDFEGAMRASLAKADYAGFEARAAEAGKARQAAGFGLSSYIECTAFGEGEEGSVVLEKDGDLHGADRHAVERAGP